MTYNDGRASHADEFGGAAPQATTSDRVSHRAPKRPPVPHDRPGDVKRVRPPFDAPAWALPERTHMSRSDYESLVRRDELTEQMEQMLDRAALSGRDLLASEQRTFDGMMTERDRVAESLAHLSRWDEQRLKRQYGQPSTVPMPPQHNRQSMVHLDEFAEMIREQRDGHVDLEVGALLAGKRTRRDGSIEHRDILTSTTGAPVPINTAASVYEYLVASSGVLRSDATIMTTAGGETYRLPRYTAYSLGTAVAEGSAIPQSDPSMALVEFKAYKYGALTEWSREIEQDTNVALGTYLGRNLGVAIAESFSSVLVNGAGTAGPQGLLGGTPAGTVTGGTGVAGVPTFDNIIDLVYSIDAPYQAQASFIMHPLSVATLSKVKDSTGRSILLPSMSTDVPSTILGFPVITDTSMPTTGTSKRSVIFGSWSRYFAVRFAGPLRVEVSYDEKFSEDVVVCKAVQRLDSRVVDPKAAAVFVGGAS